MSHSFNRINRREALSLVGAVAIAPTALSADVKFAKGAVIRTLLKDIAPSSLSGSAVLFHEHLSLKATGANADQNAPHFTDDVGLMVEEVRAAGRDGAGCIVDGGHPDMRRNIDALRRIATESGVPIVAGGGFYMQRTYPADIATKSADEIAESLVREAKEQHLGAFGEIGQQRGVLTDDEKKVFQAVGKAHVRTGLPIFTHNAYSGVRQADPPIPREAGLRQLDVLESVGAKSAQIAIGHMCCLDDPKAEIGIEIAKRGAFVGFDRVTIQAIIPDDKRVAMIMAMVEAGYANNVLISSDFYSERSTKKQGGAGVAQAWTVFAPMLRKVGMSEALLHQIMFDNPRRFLAFVPK